MTPVTPRFGFAIEYVRDIEAARRFYIEVMGLRVEREHPSFVQFDHFAIAADESMSGTDAPELHWLVDDAEGAFRDMSGRSELHMPLQEMPFGKVFAVLDADQRPRYLLELARERPSRPAS